MNVIREQDVDAIAIGAAVLGSGGGGDTRYASYMVHHHIKTYGPITIMSVEDVADDDLILPIAHVGAPIVGIERISNQQEILAVIHAATEFFGKKPTALMAAEIGGSNALTPLTVASSLYLPVVDADLLGRAFPSIAMASTVLAGVSATPIFIGDVYGKSIVIEKNDAESLEQQVRLATIAMGSSCMVAMYCLSGQQAKRGAVIARSLSRAYVIGNALLHARSKGNDPIKALQDVVTMRVIGTGIVDNVDRSIEHGFLEGEIRIVQANDTYHIIFQNEYLLVKHNNTIAGTTPDIITIVDIESGMPIASETILFGMRVAILLIKAPDLWISESGLALVGPQVFGYPVPYKASFDGEDKKDF